MRRIVVEVQGLRKRFGAKQAIDRIDLSVREGEVLGILGPTGSGQDHDAPMHRGPAQARRRARSGSTA